MSRWSRGLVSALAAILVSVGVARADYIQTLHTFTGGPADGATPGTSRLVEGTDGFLYGVTRAGGVNDGGTFFRIGKDGTGFTILHAFAADAMPTWVIQWNDGNFYGTVYEGGAGFTHYGSVFRVAPDGTFATVYDCAFESEGWNPIAMLGASNGWMYIMMSRGGITGPHGLFTEGGTLVQWLPGTACGSVAYRFPFTSFNYQPGSYLIQASDGNVYGVKSQYAGAFQLALSFGPVTMFDASGVRNGIEEGPDGAFYGAGTGGPGCGHVDRMTMTQHTIIYSFDCVVDLGGATAAPVSGGDGFLYGTTQNIFYRINTTGTVYTPLAALPGGPAGPLLKATDGRWYGMTANTIFRVMPSLGFDGDGAADMPFYDASTGSWRILTSSSHYHSSQQIFWGGPGYTPVPADYDGDGRLDVAVYRASSAVWSVLLSGSGFTTAMSQAWGGIGYVPVPGDFDGDHHADITVYRPATGQWYILQSRTDFTSAATVAFGGRGDVPVPGDYDGDGITDLALYRPATGAWRVRTSRSGFVTEIAKTLGGPGHAPVPGDYDGDGKTDIAVYDQAFGDWSVLQSSSDFTTTWTLGWGGTGYTAAPGDYDSDGQHDLAVYSAALGEWFVLQSSSHFTTTLRAIFGAPAETVITSVPVRLAWTDALRASDYDGDGTSDLAVYEPASRTWSMLESSSRFTSARAIIFGSVGDTPVPGDYDGDGRTDVATFSETSGLWSARLTSGPTFTAILGGPGDVPLPRDYDGDLITDVAVYTPSTGVWRLRFSSSGFTTITTVTWGGTPWIPVPADYDGDGRADLGVYQSSTAQWRVLLASDFTTQLTMLWGGPGYTIVPGDFDGDGKIDFAACRNATGQWWVLKSGFAYTSAFGVSWGAAIDTPVSADYDGDGIADMASYDPASGSWYVRLSSSAFILTLARTLGGPGFVVAAGP
jgi:FG-GAP-like repeat